MQRCAWCINDPLNMAYHDNEWGVPVKNPQKLFEMIILEAMQAGLNWLTVLKKREAIREAFCDFSPEKLAQLSDKKMENLLSNDSIIRNRLKIKSVKNNAQRFLHVAERENIVDYFWQFTEGNIVRHNPELLEQIPAITPESIAMAKQLKKDGFSFMGPTTCYAFMQAVGIVNDHLVSCFRHKQLAECL